MNERDRRELSLFTYTTTSRVRVTRARPGVRWGKRLLAGFALVTVVGVLLSPWRQNVAGTGRVVAYAPTDRVQSIEAPLAGRVVTWHVQEGSTVVAGDPIVDIADNDPNFLDRLERERAAVEQRIVAARSGVAMAELSVTSLEAARDGAVSNAELYVLITKDKRAEAEQGVEAAEAELKTALLDHSRQRDLGSEGLASTRKVELADLTLATSQSKRDAARAKLRAADREIQAAMAKLDNVRSKENAVIAKARESLAKQKSELAKAEGELAKTEVNLARQQSMSVVAPVSGTVLRLATPGSGEFVKPGDVVAQIVPDTASRAVELWVSGNDMPLITPGRSVRLQFEGWPAVQFVGWPSVAVGTFGGVVAFVDATDDGRGKFRVLVAPDPNDEPWPETRYLRQGVRANGWLLLDEVSVAFELWRQLNGFPPSIDPKAADVTQEGKK